MHVISSMGAGGAEKLLDEMLPILSENEKLDIELLILNKNNPVFLNKIQGNNIKVTYSPYENPRSLRNICFMHNYIRKNRFDIVHSHLFPDKYFISIIGFLLRRTDAIFVTTEHNTHNRRRDISWMKYIEKIVYKNYDRIISITDSTQKNLINWLNPTKHEKDKYIVINNGIKINDFLNALPYDKNKLDSSLSEDTKLLCMVGSFTKQKKQETIIKSLPYLSKNIKLVLVGDGERKEFLLEESRRLGVKDRVIFLGVRTDVPRIYKTIDIGIVSSNWEGFGLVAVEAMAAGKPVIASEVEGLSEVVEGYGVLFENGDAEELSKIISQLLTSPHKYKDISSSCIKRSADYDIQNMASQYQQVYMELSN